MSALKSGPKGNTMNPTAQSASGGQVAAVAELWVVLAVDFAVDAVWDMTVARGRFDRVSGSYQVGPRGAKLELTVDVTSIDTGNGMWDNLLRSTDPLNVAEYPQARFTSTQIRDSGDGTLYVNGRLEAAGKVVPVEFDAAVQRVDQELRIAATATVDRHQLGKSSGQLGLILPARVHVRARFGPGGQRPEREEAL
jgi:polyisoprenoid-binding protein YceI